MENMHSKNQTRRQFLLKSSAALSGLASFQFFSQAQGLNTHLLNSPEDQAVTSQAGQPLRGLMVDAGRVPESLGYYRRVVDFCADWELNALQFRIADDQGCAMRFASAPDLLFHENAFSPEQLKDLAHYAQSRGVDLIPELESFGHTGYITRSAAYAHLLDADSRLSSEFTGVIPVHPETLALFTRLYREISAVFPSVFLHGGCDEVNWGGSSLSRKALETRPRHQIWAEYLNSLHQVAESTGKQFIVWGDVVVHKDPRILGALNKNIVIMDWNYRETDAAKLGGTLAAIHANGSRAIGAPALINYRWGARAGKDQLANIDAFANAYFGPDHSGSLGAILTNWVPSRYIQDSIWDGFAYAAVSFREGSSRAQESAFRRFVVNHYKMDWDHVWYQVSQIIYANAPQLEREPAAGTVPLRVPWSSDHELAEVLKDPSPRPTQFSRLRGLLDQLEKQVTKNQSDFRAFALSVAYLEHLYWRETVVVELAGKPFTREDSASLIKNLAERDRTLADELSKDWDQGRFPDSNAKLKPLFGLEPKDQLVFQFQQAADYSASLASQTDRFFRLLTPAKPA